MRKEAKLPVVGSGGVWEYKKQSDENFKVMMVDSVYILIGQFNIWGLYDTLMEINHNELGKFTVEKGKIYREIEKVDPDSIEYGKRACELALSYCPPIYPCQHCGNPVADGYICSYCNSNDPGGYDNCGYDSFCVYDGLFKEDD